MTAGMCELRMVSAADPELGPEQQVGLQLPLGQAIFLARTVHFRRLWSGML